MPTTESASSSTLSTSSLGEASSGQTGLAPLTHSDKAFNEMYAQMRADLRGYFYTCLPHDQDAEDWVHDVWMRYLTAVDKGQEIHKPKHWLWKVAHNLVMDFFRHQHVLLKRNPNWTNPIPIQTFDGLDNQTFLPIVMRKLTPIIECTFPIMIANVDALMAVLPHLTNAQLEVMRLRYAQDMTFKEIAAHTGLKHNAVKARHYRAIVRLRKLMEPEE